MTKEPVLKWRQGIDGNVFIILPFGVRASVCETMKKVKGKKRYTWLVNRTWSDTTYPTLQHAQIAAEAYIDKEISQMFGLITEVEHRRWIEGCASCLRDMLNGPGLTPTHVARFTSRYTRTDIVSFTQGDFGEHSPLEVLTHLAVVISWNLN